MQVDEAQLRQEVERIRRESPGLFDAGAFVAWYLWAGPAGNVDAAVGAVTDGAHDMGIDAIYSDNKNRHLYVVQGKYRQKLSTTKSEPLRELNAFVDLARLFLNGESPEWQSFQESANPGVLKAVKAARADVQAGFSLRFVYLTLYGIKNDFFKKASSRLNALSGDAALVAMSGTAVLSLLERFLIGMAPPVESVELQVPAEAEIVNRSAGLDMEAWIVPVEGKRLVEIVDRAGVGIFAQNIRGFLGEKNPVNDAIKSTIEESPRHFMFFNNGVTMTCSATEHANGKFRLVNPQIINGQQTTRTMVALKNSLKDVRVLLRIIRIPKSSPTARQAFVGKLVEASNYQTPINKADLKANDAIQVQIEREFELLGYRYLRKKEAPMHSLYAGPKNLITIKREALARAVADCKSPALSRIAGSKPLFDEYYEHVFGDFERRYFLNCFWTSRHIDRTASNYLRKQAKFLGLFHVWQEIAEDALQRRYQFESICKWAYPQYWEALYRLTDLAVSAVAASYKLNPKVDGAVLESRPYFQRPLAFDRFEDYWRSRSAASTRKRFKNAHKELVTDLKEWAN